MYQTPAETSVGSTVSIRRRSSEAANPSTGVAQTDWRAALPVLTGNQVVLRELRTSDAASLLAMLSTEEVSRFLSPPPSTIDGYEQFIAWAIRQRGEGAVACFAVTLKGFDTAIGLFQVRQLDAAFTTGEWGFAIGSPFWASGVFADAAALVMSFVFETIGAHRLEARAAAPNGRGNGALLKIGAVQEGLLRSSLIRNGRAYDQILYGIVRHEWRRARDMALMAREAVQVH